MEYTDLKKQEVIPPTVKTRGFPDYFLMNKVKKIIKLIEAYTGKRVLLKEDISLSGEMKLISKSEPFNAKTSTKDDDFSATWKQDYKIKFKNKEYKVNVDFDGIREIDWDDYSGVRPFIKVKFEFDDVVDENQNGIYNSEDSLSDELYSIGEFFVTKFKDELESDGERYFFFLIEEEVDGLEYQKKIERLRMKYPPREEI